MRKLNDTEFLYFKKHVKCNFTDCAHGMGLAGHGVCTARGRWNWKECSEFIAVTDFLAQWKDSDEKKL